MPLHRLPEHRQGGRCRARRDPQRAAETAHDHQAVRRAGRSASRTSASSRGNGRYVDDLAPATRRCTRPSLRSPARARPHHRHRRLRRARTLDGRARRSRPTRTSTRRDGRAAAAAHPAPRADARPHPVRAWPRTRSTTSARRSSSSSPTTATSPRTPSRRIRVDYEILAARRRHRPPPARPPTSCTTTCPATSAREPGAGDRRRRRRHGRGARTRLTLDLDHRAQRVHADGGHGRRTPAGTPTTSRLHRVVLDPDLAPASAAAVAAKLGLDLAKVEVSPPTSAAASASRSSTPGPRSCWSRGRPEPLGRAGQVDRGPARALHLLRARARPAAPRRRSASTTTAGCSGSTSQFWHDHGAYTPYGLIVPIITSTQLLGPYKPGAYRVVFESLYTNTVIVTPYRGAGRPQGCFVMERTMDAIAAHLGLDRAEVRSRNFIQPDEFPYDHGLIFQDGRAAELRLRRLPGLAGQAQGAGRLGRVRRRYRAEMASARAGGSGIGLGLLRRGHRRRPLRGRARAHRDLRQGQGRHRPHHPGPGPPDGVRADRRRRARRAASRTSR